VAAARDGGGDLPHPPKMKRKHYERELLALQIELVKAQYWVKEAGERVVIVFEGRDAAGKGGTIKRFREHMNPRGARHIALAKPTGTERGEWYFQRYVRQLPTSGEIALFDRSWYNRAGVEQVMGFCTPGEHDLFLRQAPDFERWLVDDGVRLFKLWLAVNRQEQRDRLEARRTDPLKTWKLSPIDHVSLDNWDAYTDSAASMFAATHTPAAPWAVVNSNDKRTARINAIRHVLHALPYDGKDPEVAIEADPAIVAPPSQAGTRRSRAPTPAHP
jgi:polyphosphate kinase 2